MKKTFLLVLIILYTIQYGFSQDNIAEARAMGVGATVTVTGVVTNGPELGTIRYIQDETAGIGIYDWNVTDFQRGDEVTVTGVLDEFYKLLEITDLTFHTVNSTGNPLPEPRQITIDQMSEDYEGQIIQLDNVYFVVPGGIFSGNTNYDISDEVNLGEIRINTNSSLVGQVIPSATLSLKGIEGQYSYENPNTGYQLLLRDEDDIILGNSIFFTSPVKISNISTGGFDLSWTTNFSGSTEILYGNTPDLELGTLSGTGGSTDHIISITGASASEIFYIKAFSVSGSDTAFSAVKVYITQSLSSGDIKVYFNCSVDHSVSTGTDAIQLYHTIDDTLIRYINRAKYTIDLAIYNFGVQGISDIAGALNDAFFRGVDVRVVTDGGTNNQGIEQLTGGIKKLASPTTSEYGIQHNKFVIIDANSADPGDPVVWTGSTNWTDTQINTDPNDVIIIRDQSLARAYTLEFEEMWGSLGMEPDPGNSRFGPYKNDNTPHEFIINGKRVECYFSPSDGVNGKIISTLNTAGHTAFVNTMLITRSDIGYALSDLAQGGITTKVIVKDQNDCTQTVVNTLTSALGSDFRESGEPGIHHHKLVIIDEANVNSDPIVLTGSHNWSNSADTRNDENTLIVHDQTIANIYYQEFVVRFRLGVSIGGNIPSELELGPDTTICAGQSYLIDAGASFDTYEWSTGATTQAINVDSTNVGIGSQKFWVTVSFEGNYQVDTIVVTFVDCTGIDDKQNIEDLKIFPNPTDGNINIFFRARSTGVAIVKILDLLGRGVLQDDLLVQPGLVQMNLDLGNLPEGTYLLKLSFAEGMVYRKIIIR